MKRFEREEGVAFYNAEEDEEEKTKKLKRKETDGNVYDDARAIPRSRKRR